MRQMPRTVLAGALLVVSIGGGVLACGGDDQNLSPTREQTEDDKAALTAVTNETGDTFDIRTTSTDVPTTPCDFVVAAMARIAADANLAAEGDATAIDDGRDTLQEIPGELPPTVVPDAEAWAARMSEFFDNPEALRSEILSAEWIAETARVDSTISAACDE